MTAGFRSIPGSLEGKWFWTSADDALTFATQMGDDGFRIVEAQVSREAFGKMLYRSSLDRIGPAVYAELDDLAAVAARIIR